MTKTPTDTDTDSVQEAHFGDKELRACHTSVRACVVLQNVSACLCIRRAQETRQVGIAWSRQILRLYWLRQVRGLRTIRCGYLFTPLDPQIRKNHPQTKRFAV